MHEMGIVTHLAKTLDETARENGIRRIGSVTLQVGEVSGIMTVTFCDCCKKTYPTVRYGRECPYCHSGETWLLRGNECMIKEITAETDQEES